MTARHMIFTVEVTELASGWAVEVEGDDDHAAAIKCHDLDTALEMAVPFMSAVTAPDPLEQAFGLPPAPDGPSEARDADR